MVFWLEIVVFTVSFCQAVGPTALRRRFRAVIKEQCVGFWIRCGGRRDYARRRQVIHRRLAVLCLNNLRSVLTLYAKTGGKNGKHGWTELFPI
jgi:hypothetical protein